MKTLDEVIKALKMCTLTGYCSDSDGDCPYLGNNKCGAVVKIDAIYYLEQYHNYIENKMKDLVYKKEVIDKIREVYEYEFPTASGAFDEFVTMIIPNILRNLPTAEQKESKWIIHDYTLGIERYECAECGGRCDLEYNFCPHCGTKMRGSCADK